MANKKLLSTVIFATILGASSIPKASHANPQVYECRAERVLQANGSFTTELSVQPRINGSIVQEGVGLFNLGRCLIPVSNKICQVEGTTNFGIDGWKNCGSSPIEGYGETFRFGEQRYYNFSGGSKFRFLN